MGKTVVVAEKPSVGRDIARVLKCSGKQNGYMENDKYIVTWAVGHLVTLQEPDELDPKYKKWSNSTLPILPDTIPLKVIPQTRDQYNTVKALINRDTTESVICATDAGREGELIFRYIYEMAGCHKPIYRLWISSMTDQAITEGFNNIKPGADYEGLYSSARCRSQADWLVGMNATRAFTLRYDNILSVGRVQTPTLAILTKRRAEIENFKPEKFYTLTCNFGDYKGMWFNPDQKVQENSQEKQSEGTKKQSTDTHIPDRKTAEEIAKQIKDKEGIITSAEKTKGTEPAPQLYDLTSLQRDANRLLGFTADKTLQVAQSLYETRKALTYPRTDSRYLPPDMIPRVQETAKKLPDTLSKFMPGIYSNGKLRISSRTVDASKVTDHHAIIPTPLKVNISAFTEDERQIYDMVARRMLAAFYPACVFSSTKIITTVEGNQFRTTGKMILEQGWREIPALENPPYSKGEKTDNQETLLPQVKKGDKRIVKDTAIKEDSTKPPQHHNDASLLGAMEAAGKELEDEEIRQQMKGSGIGTPATRAAIIERLIQVKYAERKKKNIIATDKGMKLISIMPEELSSPAMTGKWELALDKIASGSQDPVKFVESIKRFSAFLVDYAQHKSPEVDFPADPGRKKPFPENPVIPGVLCPVCGKGKMEESDRAFSCKEKGCSCVIWKDCLTRGGGPVLNTKIFTMLLTAGQVHGSTGTIVLDKASGTMAFYPQGSQTASTTRPLIWKKQK